MKDKISVIISVYNTEKYIKRCLNSLVHQTYENLEIIIVDDGSMDSSYKICRQFQKKDCRIKLFHQDNSGQSAARNLGLKKVTGEWISFVDSDDWVEPDFYSVFFDKMRCINADIYVIGSFSVYKNGKKRRVMEIEDSRYSNMEAITLLCENKRMTGFVYDKLFKKKLFDDLYFVEGRTYEDTEISHRLFSRANQVVSISQYKYNYFQRDDSTVHVKINILDWYWALQERYAWICREIQMGNKELVPAENMCFADLSNVAFYNLYTIPAKDIFKFTKAQKKSYRDIKMFWRRNKRRIASVSIKLRLSIYFPHVIRGLFISTKKLKALVLKISSQCCLD